MGLLSALTGGGWQAPTFTMPMQTFGGDLKLLGVDHLGRSWYRHRQYGEMIETGTIDATIRPLPDGVIVEVGPSRYRTFQPPVAPGTYERFVNTTARGPNPPKPHRPVDALGHLFLAAPRPERVTGSAAGVHIREAEASARGPVEILTRLTRAGATARLSTDGLALVVTTAGGSLGPGILELVDAAGPLLLAHLRGAPLACTVGKHKTPVPAVSIALGGAPACEACLGGAS